MGGRKQFICVVSFWAAAVLLSGCSGGSDDPTPTASEESAPSTSEATAIESTSAAPTAEPTESVDSWAAGPPAVTWEMRLDDEAGAIAFVEYYQEVANYSFDTLDSAELTRISDDDCVGCNAMIETLETMSEENIRRIGGERTLVSVINAEYFPDSAVYIIDIESADAAATLVDSDGNTLQSAGATSGGSSFAVRFNSSYDWTMISMGKPD